MSCRSILPAKATKAALRRLLKNSEKQIPHRLKAASMTKVKGLNGTTEVVPFPKQRSNRVFPQPVRLRTVGRLREVSVAGEA